MLLSMLENKSSERLNSIPNFISSFIHSFKKILPSYYCYVPDGVLGVEI